MHLIEADNESIKDQYNVASTASPPPVNTLRVCNVANHGAHTSLEVSA